MTPVPPANDDHLPSELLELRRLYARVPTRVDIKFQTEPGQDFLTGLRRVIGVHPVTRIAAALGVTTTTIYTMRKVPRVANPKRWPTDQEMVGIKRTWAKVRGHGYFSREHHAMHVELKALLDAGFVLVVIARKMRVPLVELERFVRAPVPPIELSRSAQAAVNARNRQIPRR